MSAKQKAILEIKHVGVIGAGTMGHGIAQVAAMAGYSVSMYDVDQAFLDKALKRIAANLEKGVSLGKVKPQVRDRALGAISTTTRLAEAAAHADLIVEAAPEKMELKREIFAQLDKASPPHALLATNTSSLSISRIAEATRRPELVLGMHFFNPVHIMKLLEIVRTEVTGDEVIEAARALALAIGKTPIVVKDSPGFATSRLGLTLGLEATRMLDEGVASVEDIDTAMELGYGHPMGPFKLADLVGLDVRLAISEYMYRETGSPLFKPSETLKRLVSEGKLGKKTGQGFYSWDKE
jgi:3-hydroxybutyryl-CoA dehydrogenase